jgi:hypothetical protein
MMQSINDAWAESDILNSKFDTIVLDYFFSPAGWARERWTENFFEKTIPFFAEKDLLKVGGTFWLPRLAVTDELIENSYEEITTYYDIKYVSKANENPLYMATETATQELLKCPDKLTNETQIQPLLDHSEFPFVCLTRRNHALQAKSSMTPRKQKRSVVVLLGNSPKRSSRRKLMLE